MRFGIGEVHMGAAIILQKCVPKGFQALVADILLTVAWRECLGNQLDIRCRTATEQSSESGVICNKTVNSAAMGA